MNKLTKRITFIAMMLALMCLVGMLSIPLGNNIKVSLQFLIVLIIFGLTDNLMDKILIMFFYLLIGLFIPVYAGFNVGVTPTFGFVIGFLVTSLIFHLISQINFKNETLKFYIASLFSLLVVYLFGSLFLALFLELEYFSSLLISVVPYIPFDILKIIIASLIVKRMKLVINKK